MPGHHRPCAQRSEAPPLRPVAQRAPERRSAPGPVSRSRDGEAEVGGRFGVDVPGAHGADQVVEGFGDTPGAPRVLALAPT